MTNNIYRFPSGRTFLPDSRVQERELSLLDQDRIAMRVFWVVLILVGFAISSLTFAGYLLFNLVDLG